MDLVFLLTCVTSRVEGWIFAWARTAAVLRQQRKALLFRAGLYLLKQFHQQKVEKCCPSFKWSLPMHAQLDKLNHVRKIQ